MLKIAWWTFMLAMVGAGLVEITTAYALSVRRECYLTYRHIRRADLSMQRRELVHQCVREKMGTIGAK